MAMIMKWPQWSRCWRIAVLVTAMMMLLPNTVGWAHATLLQADPPSGSIHDDAPEQVRLTFNERLEDALYYITVWDEQGRSVTKNEATMNQSREELQLELPELKDGVYTVSYKVISADGHPVRASYIFVVGEAAAANQISTGTGGHNHNHGFMASFSNGEWQIFLSRIVYFAILMLLTGYLIWGNTYRKVTAQWLISSFRSGILFGLTAFTIVFIWHMLVQGSNMLDGWQWREIAAISRTGTGLSWMSQLALIAIGYTSLGKRWTFDLAWAIALLIAKSLNGHAFAHDLRIVTVSLDVLHLMAASLWVGGISLLLVTFKKDKSTLSDVFRIVSKWALLSVLALSVTGVIATFLYVPSIMTLWETSWGIWLTVKVALMLLAVIIGGLLRYFRKHQIHRFGVVLHADVLIAFVIIFIVGIFTYLSPQPANMPLNWHIMGEKMHLDTQISPNTPGHNRFVVTVWVWDHVDGPKHVKLSLFPNKEEDTGAIDVPLEQVPSVNAESFVGFQAYTYEANGAYLPFAGEWRVELRVMDADDNEIVEYRMMKLYPTTQ